MPWLKSTPGPDAKPALDVLVVGAGQSGVAIAFGLMRSQVTNILVLDRAEEGEEGPWLSYARMHTLRSPKHYTGPDLDIPSLTYQSWHEARFGNEHWQTLGLIPRTLWAEYLLWFRRAIGLAVRNGCELLEIAPTVIGRRKTNAAIGSAAIPISPTTMLSRSGYRDRRPGFPTFICLHLRPP